MIPNEVRSVSGTLRCPVSLQDAILQCAARPSSLAVIGFNEFAQVISQPFDPGVNQLMTSGWESGQEGRGHDAHSQSRESSAKRER